MPKIRTQIPRNTQTNRLLHMQETKNSTPSLHMHVVRMIKRLGIYTGLASMLTKDDLIFIISVLITILNLYLNYLETKRLKNGIKTTKPN